MLRIWPELPIFINATGGLTAKAERDACIVALKLHRRVSGIRLQKTSDLALKTFVSRMQRPFPALSHLLVRPDYSRLNVVISPVSRSFLGGSAPSLRVLVLVLFPFPALPELLLSATNLIRLEYDHIPPTGYISPQALVTGLSALTRLESLSLSFQSPDDFFFRTWQFEFLLQTRALSSLLSLIFASEVILSTWRTLWPKSTPLYWRV